MKGILFLWFPTTAQSSLLPTVNILTLGNRSQSTESPL